MQNSFSHSSTSISTRFNVKLISSRLPCPVSETSPLHLELDNWTSPILSDICTFCVRGPYNREHDILSAPNFPQGRGWVTDSTGAVLLVLVAGVEWGVGVLLPRVRGLLGSHINWLNVTQCGKLPYQTVPVTIIIHTSCYP